MGLLELKKLLWERPFEEDEKREEIFENYNKGRQPGCIKNSQNSTVKKKKKRNQSTENMGKGHERACHGRGYTGGR